MLNAVLLGLYVPAPPDHVPLVADPPIVPIIEIAAPLHVVLSGPAFAVAGEPHVVQLVTVINAVSDDVHPLPLV